MLENKTKEDIDQIANNMKESLSKDSEKFKDKSLVSNPIVISVLVILIMALAVQPTLLIYGAMAFGLVVLFKSNDAKTVLKTAIAVPRDILKNRKQLKDEAKAALQAAKDKVTPHKDDKKD